MVLTIKCSDKKNENKEVAVNEVQPASTARDAIQYSMLVSNSSMHFQASHWVFQVSNSL